MRIVLSLLLMILMAFEGAVIAYLVTVVIADRLTELGGMSNFEGGRGYFVGLVVGPVGGVIGLLGGAIVGWRTATRPATPASVLLVFGTTVTMLGLAWSIWSYA